MKIVAKYGAYGGAVVLPSHGNPRMYLALLRELDAAGGAATPDVIYPRMRAYFPEIVDNDLQLANSGGENKWTNRIRWSRQDLATVGLIDSSERGVWILTPAGKKWLDKNWRGPGADYSTVTRPRRIDPAAEGGEPHSGGALKVSSAGQYQVAPHDGNGSSRVRETATAERIPPDGGCPVSQRRNRRDQRAQPGAEQAIEADLANLVAQHNHAVREGLHRALLEMTPGAFEQLIGRLLKAIGFESVVVTNRSGDGGIDVRGILVVGDVIRTSMAVQVKRWKANVQAPIVQQVRGSLGTHEQGLIITTSGFSPGARDEAERANAVPVALMDGRRLVELLVKYNIGVQHTALDLIEPFHESEVSADAQ